MNSFDLNQHFNTYKKNLFFDDKTYSQLLSDVRCFSYSLSVLPTSLNGIALKVQSPYLAFVAILASIMGHKLPILLSHLEADSQIEKLKKQIFFEKIILDQDIINSFSSSNSCNTFPEFDFNEGRLVIFSSGSTNLPKGIVLSFNNLYYSAKGFSEYFNQLENEVSLMNLPHHHVGGLMILWRAFFSGGSLTTYLNLPIDYISLVPLQLKRMIEDQNKLLILKKIKTVLVGGSRFQETLKIEAIKSGLNIFETYGMSETTSLVTINGNILPYREVELDDEGFFIIKGLTLALGFYVQNIFQSYQAHWYKTSDIGFRDEAGALHFKERADLIFISGGENINPLNVEEVLNENKLIKVAYLASIPDEKWGEMGILLYESELGSVITNEDFHSFFDGKIHPYHIPKFYFKTEFQLNEKIKAKRTELKELAYQYYLKNIFSYDYVEVPNAPLIVFFHGFMGDKEDLKGISHLEDATFSKLYLDLPGHGQTQIKNFYSFSDVFQKISEFIKIFSPQPIFYGYSMGGRIALHLALNFLNPKLLILESASLGLKDIQEQTERKIQDIQQLAHIHQGEIKQFLNQWYENPIFKNFKNHPSYQLEIDKKAKHDFKEWRDSQLFLSAGSFPLFSENCLKISKLDFKISYIYGELDIKYKTTAQQIQILNPGNNIATWSIPEASHNPHTTHPIETKDKLINILK